MTALTFNAQAFALFVHTRREQLGLPVRAAADAAGVSHSQFFRAERGQPVSISACLTICRWLGMTVEAFALDAATGRIVEPVSRETNGDTRSAPEFSEAAQ